MGDVMGTMNAPLMTPDHGIAAYEKVAAASCAYVPAEPQKVAASILETLGYEAVEMPRQSFNDDDYYVYHPLTLQLQAHYPASQRHRLMDVAKGMAADKGMQAKWLGLWKLREVKA